MLTTSRSSLPFPNSITKKFGFVSENEAECGFGGFDVPEALMQHPPTTNHFSQKIDFRPARRAEMTENASKNSPVPSGCRGR
jgi:hypothetical protein